MKMTTSMMIRITLTAPLFVVGIALALIIPSHITVAHILSIAFTSIAYLTAAAIFVLSAMDNIQNSIQNFGVKFVAAVCFIVCFLAPLVLDIAGAGLKLQLLLEIIIRPSGSRQSA